MKLMKYVLTWSFLFLIGWSSMKAQNRYHTHPELTTEMKNLVQVHPDIANLISLGKTEGGRDIWALTVGKGETGNKPGIAVVGGIDGRYVLGTEIAFSFASRLIENADNSDISSLLDKVTFYILPSVNPDACSQFHASIQYERTRNMNPTDNDRDFKTDEDPFEDLNGDGLITLMRVPDVTGAYITSKDDKRLMVKADLSNGETGQYRVWSEGIDNDQDGLYNEDDIGGVNFNNNFSFNYEEFGTEAGLNAVSEKESKAVADFLYDRFNIYMVVSFGPQDNLGKPMKSNPREQAQAGEDSQQSFRSRRQRGPVTSIQKEDEQVNKLISDLYHKETGYTGAPESTATPGNFADWAYFHYGRYSFSTPGWWVSPEKELSPEATLLKQAGENTGNLFVEWQPVEHPGFPGKTLEVGGIKPFALTVPNDSLLNGIIDSHYNFIISSAQYHPDIELVDVKVKNVEKDIYRISAKLHNRGVFATINELGTRNSWVRMMTVELTSQGNLTFLSGQKKEITNRLRGDEYREFNWLVRGEGEVNITAGAVNCGFDEVTLELK